MYYGDIKNCDAANGPGVRISLFVSGCTHKCKGCFNEATWDFCYGDPYGQEQEDKIIELLRPSYITGLTVLGGEPMEPQNQPEVLKLLRRVRKEFGDSKSIWVYSGYLFDKDIVGRMFNEVPETKELISLVDVMMDGPFVLELLDKTLYFRGSSNQRAIDVPATIADNYNIHIWEPHVPKYIYSNT